MGTEYNRVQTEFNKMNNIENDVVVDENVNVNNFTYIKNVFNLVVTSIIWLVFFPAVPLNIMLNINDRSFFDSYWETSFYILMVYVLLMALVVGIFKVFNKISNLFLKK